MFTMHDITFGLEVCLDHGEGRLKKYYGTPDAKGKQKVQVQLIPSCGMSIKKPCTVANGLIFNVDAKHHAAKTHDGTGNTIGTQDITAYALKEDALAPAGTTLADYFPAKGGITVYHAKTTPAKEAVA